MTIEKIKQKITDLAELDRATAQIFWATAFHEDGKLTNSIALQKSVNLMKAACVRESVVDELDALNPTQKEITYLLKILKDSSPHE